MYNWRTILHKNKYSLLFYLQLSDRQEYTMYNYIVFTNYHTFSLALSQSCNEISPFEHFIPSVELLQV